MKNIVSVEVDYLNEETGQFETIKIPNEAMDTLLQMAVIARVGGAPLLVEIDPVRATKIIGKDFLEGDLSWWKYCQGPTLRQIIQEVMG